MVDLSRKFAELIDYAMREDFPNFEALLGAMTPNQCVDLEEYYKEFPEILDNHWAPMVWALSDTWGFEITWAAFYRDTPENQAKLRDKLDPPALEELTPDVPLFEHMKWGPRDRGVLQLELAHQGKTWAQVMQEVKEMLENEV